MAKKKKSADRSGSDKQNIGNRKEETRAHGWSNVSYTMRVSVSFALISLMTILVAFGVLSWVWEQHFQTYTHDNMERLCTSTADAIADRYETTNNWAVDTLAPASSTSGLNKNVGIQVIDADGTIRYDNSGTASNTHGITLAPSKQTQLVSAPIMVNDDQVGTVKVWVHGSDTLLTAADAEFRSQSYSAMAVSMCAAVLIALIVGFFFARNLVNPINKMTRTARAIKEGELDARTGLTGEDEVARLGETFDAMADAIEKDRMMERRLTTDVAHELRTPLMAIQSTVEAMIDGVFDADEERLSTVNAEVQRLSRLVDALLKLSRLENRKVPMNKVRLNLGELIESIVATHEAYVNDSGLSFSFTKDDDVYVYGDPDMLRQATANLISNAVRYTPEGSVSVRVSRGDIMATISVQDTGIGLTPDEAKMVFSRFWRADAGRNRAQGGLGIGLSVVKEIVDRHNGWVRVDGQKDVGATFTIYIPLYDESREKMQSKERGRTRRDRDRARNQPRRDTDTALSDENGDSAPTEH